MKHTLPLILLLTTLTQAAPKDYFLIRVVDEATNRPVPLVELTTTNNIRHYTDSAGHVAFLEPGLMDTKVHFTLKSHGYEYPADGFGTRGATLQTTPGTTATLKIKRLNIAQRLYRLTGQGIYADTLLAGLPAPMGNPLLNARVVGQDSAVVAVVGDTAYWTWGDTAKPDYPLGHFGTALATVDLKSVDPERAINFNYVTAKDGFSAPTFKLPDLGPVWVGGAVVLPDDQGKDTILVHYSRVKDLGTRLEHGLAAFDFNTKMFAKLKALPLDEPLNPDGHALRVDDHFYFAAPVPLLRVKADWKSATTPAEYEAFTALAPGTRYAKEKSKIDRNANGKVVYAWKKNTPPIQPGHQKELIKAGLLKPEEAYLHPRDAHTNEEIELHGGSVHWNAFRNRYVMIALQIGGKTSLLGEVYYLESTHPEGPWTTAVKIITHDKYTFYNPVHHPFLDRDNGRTIYFEGTYDTLFSGTQTPTPRYNYNQLLYRLDLDDPRLKPAHTPRVGSASADGVSPSSPSPGTPGEGRGEGRSAQPEVEGVK